MPIPKAVARVNRVVTNRVFRLFAGRAPWFGVVMHRGRRSGRSYRTPINVFRVPGGYVVALTYGPDTDWVKNVLADGGCVLETRGRRVTLRDPRILRDETRRDVPTPVRRILGVLDVAHFLYLTETSGARPD